MNPLKPEAIITIQPARPDTPYPFIGSIHDTNQSQFLHEAIFAIPNDIERNISAQIIYPGRTWQQWNRPEDAGFSTETIQTTRTLLNSFDTTSMVIAKGGKIAFTYGDPKEVDYTASIRKSILAMLFGKYVENGTIDLNATLEKLDFNDIGGLSVIERQATILHLIAAKSGIYHTGSNPGDDTADAPPRDSQIPGTYFLYNNWDFNAAGAIFEKLTGKNIYDALQQDLAIPIGMEDFDRTIQQKTGDPKKSLYPAYYIWLSTQDMARIGYLMLHKGRWEDQQVIPKNWVERIISVETPSADINSKRIQQEGLFEFGLMWWIFKEDSTRPWTKGAFMARGAYGQYITVIPALDVVVAHKTSINLEDKEAWDRYMKDHAQEEPENRSNVSMAQYMQILDSLFK